MWRCKCLLCGQIIETRARNLKSGHIKSCGKKHRRVEDLTGRDFGDLHVIERAENVIAKDGTSYVMWHCLCKCGNTCTVRATSLKNGHTKSCGVCSRSRSNMGHGLIDITNQDFGFWHVLGQSRSVVQPNGRRVTLWTCQCRCGEIRELRAGTLKRGLSYSCGCHKLDVLREKAKSGFGISKAEQIVNQYLKDNGFYYESQKTFVDLRGSLGIRCHMILLFTIKIFLLLLLLSVKVFNTMSLLIISEERNSFLYKNGMMAWNENMLTKWQFLCLKFRILFVAMRLFNYWIEIYKVFYKGLFSCECP